VTQAPAAAHGHQQQQSSRTAAYQEVQLCLMKPITDSIKACPTVCHDSAADQVVQCQTLCYRYLAAAAAATAVAGTGLGAAQLFWDSGMAAYKVSSPAQPPQ
jgi:hypothetical protein